MDQANPVLKNGSQTVRPSETPNCCIVGYAMSEITDSSNDNAFDEGCSFISEEETQYMTISDDDAEEEKIQGLQNSISGNSKR